MELAPQAGAFFVCFWVVWGKKRSKITKIQEKCKNMRKNLHISKFFCTFAPDFKNKPIKGGGNTIKTATKT